jgi:PAS domain S-box-containing protein
MPTISVVANGIVYIGGMQMGNASCLELHRETMYRYHTMEHSKLVCRFRTDGTLTYANDLYCRYFGKQLRDVIGNSVMQFVAPEDTAKIHQHIEILSKTKTFLSLDYQIIAPDSTIRRHQWTFRTLLDSAGNISEFHATGRELAN